MNSQFVHLHLHTEYSLVNGMVKIPELMHKLKQFGQTSIAITDQYNLFAAVKFYREALKHKIKPIIGAEVIIFADDQSRRLILLSQNQQGYQNLKQLISQSYLQGQRDGIPTINKSWLSSENTQGLIALSGGMTGEIGQHIINDKLELAILAAKFWAELFSNRFYLELTRAYHTDEELVISQTVEIAAKLQLPVVATNNVHFLAPDDFESHEARVCISQGTIVSNPNRSQEFTAEQYLTDSETMLAKFKDIPSAITNSQQIASRCTVELEFGKHYLPDFPIPDKLSGSDYFTQIANQGLIQRLEQLFKSPTAIAAQQDKFQARLELELKVIIDMGFTGYFLIVAEFIAWAKSQNIRVGPGRGSGAGSLVAFVLGITNIEPLHYELLFERFLNPERVSMPDFDIDFCMQKRDLVIEYVANKYGKDKVSQIITYSNMNAKGVVRDVGRVLGFAYGLCDSIARLIPFDLNMTLSKALELSTELQTRYDTESEVKDIIDLALKLEGLKRNVGKHAAGLVISPSNINNFSPIYCENNEGEIVTQFDKDDIEEIGLVKFDFLGLRTLTVIDWALDNIKQLNPKLNIDIDAIDLADKKVYKLLQQGKATAVFQMESAGLQSMLVDLKPTEFEDIIAAVALYRPGPLEMQMDKTYIERKHGTKFEYIHPSLAGILKPTYGVIVYQEQVMQIAQILAGFSLGEADILRRAMGKKKASEMAQQRAIFEQGAVKRGVDKTMAAEVFDLMETFASYGFNKSHSVAYAYISYQTAWLKAHYPAEFMAAVLSSEMDNLSRVVRLISECNSFGVEVLPPDINHSKHHFTASSSSEIIFGLGAIKDLGGAAIESIIAAREEGKFGDFYDFCSRVDTRKVNKKGLVAIINAGAFDSLADDQSKPWQSRATFAANLADALQNAVQLQNDAASGQADLFATDHTETQKCKYLVPHKPWIDDVRLFRERDSIGIFLTGHPINRHLPELKNFITHKISKLNKKINFVCFAGLVVSKSLKTTKAKKQIAIVSLEDESDRVELALFSGKYLQYEEIIAKDKILVITASVKEDTFRGGIKIQVNEIFTTNQAKIHFAKCLEINYQQQNTTQATELATILTPFKDGKCPVKINYQTVNAGVQIMLADDWRLVPDEILVSQLNNLPWVDSAEIKY